MPSKTCINYRTEKKEDHKIKEKTTGKKFKKIDDSQILPTLVKRTEGDGVCSGLATIVASYITCVLGPHVILMESK